jgi:hypothetical protein
MLAVRKKQHDVGQSLRTEFSEFATRVFPTLVLNRLVADAR